MIAADHLMWVNGEMLSWWVIAGIIAAGAAAGGATGYLASRRAMYRWVLGYDPYWRRWVWVPIYC